MNTNNNITRPAFKIKAGAYLEKGHNISGKETPETPKDSLNIFKIIDGKLQIEIPKENIKDALGDLKSFSEVVKDTEKSEGLFNTYKTKDGKLYLEIPPNQLNNSFLLSTVLKNGLAAFPGEAGTFPEMIQNRVCEFQRVNNNVRLVEKNTNFTAEPGSPAERSLKKDYPESILANLKLVSINQDKQSLLIDISKLVLSDDFTKVDAVLHEVFDTSYRVESDTSIIEKASAFPSNVEIDSSLNFVSSSSKPQVIVPDQKSIPLKIHFGFASLPKEGYTPRLADDRVGFFESAVKNLSDTTLNGVSRYINRWDTNKGPVTFWIENTTPLEYRKAVSEGVLEWNKAFEKAGIPNAIDVKVQPDNPDWDAGDMRYNVIRWTNSYSPVFAGYGPMLVNPSTGEIYHAEIVIDGEAMRMMNSHYDKLELLQNLPQNEAKSGKISNHNTHQCQYASLSGIGASLGALNLALDASHGELLPPPASFINAYIKDVVMHEVGHCLGLRHNFHGSTLHSMEDLTNPEITHKTGLSASIMDYTPVNILAFGKNDVEDPGRAEYFSSTIGPYDTWAIEYGYHPTGAQKPNEEKEFLKNIASQSVKPEHVYGTDEDQGVDPNVSVFDLSSDPLAFAGKQLDFSRDLFKKIAEKLPSKDGTHGDALNAFVGAMNSYFKALGVPLRHLGGEYFHRANIGSAATEPPLAPVEKEKQKQALKMLDEYLFDRDAFSFSPELLNKLAPERQTNNFNRATRPSGFPLIKMVTDVQDRVLGQLFDGGLLNRLIETSHKTSDKSKVLTVGELFQHTFDSVWKELPTGEDIATTRKALQQSHIKQLVKLKNNEVPTFFGIPLGAAAPPDAQNLASYQLETLQKEIRTAMRSNNVNLETQAHLNSCLATVDKALQ